MKKVIAVVLALVLTALGAYVGFGLLARKNYEMAIVELQANFPGHIESSYKQGLFTSDLDIKLAIPLPDTNPATPETMAARIKQTIHHGPFIVGANRENTSQLTPVQLYAQGTLELEPFMADEPQFVSQLRQLASTDITVFAPISGRTQVSFTGRAQQSALMIGNDTFNLNWQGFAGNLSLLGTNLLTYDLDFRAPGLEIKGTGPTRMIIEEISTAATMMEGSHELSLGTVMTAIKKFEVIYGQSPEEKITLAGLDVRISSSEEEELLRVDEEISLANLQFADKKYGPGNLKISLTNLDTESIANLTEAYKSMQAHPGNTEVMALGLLSSHATALLAKSPEIRVENLSLTSPEGACLSSAHLAFNGEGEVIMNPLFLLGRLSAEADFSADERFMAVQAKNLLKESICGQRTDPDCDQEAARASSKQLKALIDQNILLLSAGRYSMTASFKNGQPMLNGQPVPLSF